MKELSLLMVALVCCAVVSAGATEPAAIPAAAILEKSYEQLVQKRLREGFDAIAGSRIMSSRKPDSSDTYKSLLLFNLNKDIEEAERNIQNFCGKPVPQNRSEAFFRIYLTEKTRRLLSPKTKAVIEDYAWELLTKNNRNITRADADKPFWKFSSSENHYVNDRRRYTQALQIVRMADRYGPIAKLEGASIESHYQAWTAFWIRYFQVRAGQGVDMEIAHPSSYGECTVGVYYDLYDLTDSPRLRELAGNFLTLYWAEVAAEFEPRTGQRALASTRNPDFTGNLAGWARDLLYGYGWHDGGCQGNAPGLPFLLSSYRPPEILRAIACNVNRGVYQTTSRRALLVESQEKEKSGVIVFDDHGDGHFRRDVYYTPDYTLSTMTLDPSRQYCGVGDLAQAMGVTCAADLPSRIVVTGTGYYAKRALSGITGAAVSIIARDPNAQFGRGRFMSEGTRVFIRNGPLWDNRIEDPSGWFFTRCGDAYAAIRMPGGYRATTRTFHWPSRKLEEVPENNGHHLELQDMWAPIVIQMGRATDYQSFEAFQTSVKARKFEYDNGKLTYESEAKDRYEYWAKGAQLPQVNGTTVNLNPAKTYDSPYLSMEHGTNKAVIHYQGYKAVELDFGNPANPGAAKHGAEAGGEQ